MTPESNKVYQRAWKRFVSFMTDILEKPYLPASEQSVAAYVAHLHRTAGLKVSTIRCHLSSITFHHKVNSLPSPVSSSFLLDKLLLAYAKANPDTDQRLPITFPVLSAILQNITSFSNSPREKALLSALFSLMYHGLLRVSEVAKTEGPTDHTLQLSQLTLTQAKQPELLIQFASCKHSKSPPPPARIASSTAPECPVRLYTRYLIHRGKFSPASKAFCYPDSTPISREYVAKSLHSILALAHFDPSKYNTHSFRIGRATDLATSGASDRQIMLAGRWKSLAFKKYIRPSVVIL